MEALQEVKATLLMPLASKDELLGFISLGPRLGDLPFSREDKQLLMSVSGPTAFAIENAGWSNRWSLKRVACRRSKSITDARPKSWPSRQLAFDAADSQRLAR